MPPGRKTPDHPPTATGRGRSWSGLPHAALLLVGLATACAAEQHQAAPEGGHRRVIRAQQQIEDLGCTGTGEPTFSAGDVFARTSGAKQTSISIRSRPFSAPLADETGAVNMTVSVRLLGRPRTEHECGRVDHDAELTLAFEQPALDLVLTGTLSAYSDESASFRTELDVSVVKAMRLPGLDRPPTSTLLSLLFARDGVRGELLFQGTCGRRAVIPADDRCGAAGEAALGLDEMVRGVALRDVVEPTVQWLSMMRATPVRWRDGADTTLSVRIEETPIYVCANTSSLEHPEREVEVRAPLRVHLTTADQSVDVSLAAQLSWPINPVSHARPGEADGWQLKGWAQFTPAALRDAGLLSQLDFPDDHAVHLYVDVSESRSFSLWWTISFSSYGFSHEAAGVPEGWLESPDAGNIDCFSDPSGEIGALHGPHRTE